MSSDKEQLVVSEQQDVDGDAAYLDRLRDVAISKYGSNSIEIEPLTMEDISEADKGVWVRGWLWLRAADIGDVSDEDADEDDDSQF